MELIQNSVYNREGKKWKQRWAILKKVAPKAQSTSNDAFFYLFLYKDGVHAKERKEKHVLPLIDFCGLEPLRQYDKAKNVLVLITAMQTTFLSFENVQLRDQWVRILIDNFGDAATYDISIPDRQKLKAGQATLRLYPSFFSIITSKNFRCLNRWYTNDILGHSAQDETQFMFEIGPPNKTKGLLVNIVVPNAESEAISKKFAEYENSETMTPRDFHGSSPLDELGQAKRNAGDSNFIRRAILRASDRMRKKIRDRSRTTPSSMKRSNNAAMSTSMSEENKFRSIDRKTSPDIGVQLNDATMAQTVMLRTLSATTSPPPFITRQISIDEPAPQLPKKRSPNQSSSSQVSSNDKRHPVINDDNSKHVPKERTLFKPRSKTTSDIPVMSAEAAVNSYPKPSSSKSEEQLGMNLSDKDVKSNETVISIRREEIKSPQSDIIITDSKSDIIQAYQRKFTDSPVNNNINVYKQPANPARYAISKTKRPSMKSVQKTPTPPPRSPVSLGLTQQPNVFNFPPTNDVIEDTTDGMENKKCERKSSFLTEIDKEVKRRTMNSEDFSDDAFTYSSEPSPANSYHSYYSQSESYIRNEPAYGNIDTLRRDSSDDSGSINVSVREPPRRWRRESTKHLSDPLGVEQWTVATGDGQPIKNNVHEFAVDRHDYLNVKGTQNHNDDSDHDSYVNVTSSGPGKPELERSFGKRKRNVPEPLRLPSFKNDFEKYDDDDTNIYHPVGAVDNDSSSSTGCISYRNGGGSFEDMNIKTKNNRNHSDYLNLMSPAPKLNYNKTNSSKLNYVTIGSTGVLSGLVHSKSVSTSPIRLSARSPIETYNKSDYTRIDDDRTAALNRSMVEHRQQVIKQSGNKTPTKSSK